MALRWACENGVTVEIWTDSQYAWISVATRLA